MRLSGLYQTGVRCPVCSTPKSTLHVAVAPIVLKGELYQPDEYAVCDPCHTAQYTEKYGYPPGEVPATTEAWE